METTLQRFTMPDGAIVEVHFDFDAYFNATEAAKQFGKEPKDWLRTQSTKDYLAAVSQSANMPIEELVVTRQGRPDQGGGTWMHPKVAVEFARWLNPFFGVQCNEVIEAILRGRALVVPSPQCSFSEGRRRSVFLGLTRPELATLLGYTKLWLQHHVLASGLADDACFDSHLNAYFPEAIIHRFLPSIVGHRLRRRVSSGNRFLEAL